MANRSNDIVQAINSISGKYSSYEVFSNWVELCALSIQNACYIHTEDDVYKEREKQYLQIISRYSESEQKKLSEMLSMLVETLETEITDVLGYVFMKSQMGSSALGQFFTPFHVAELCARIAYNYEYNPDADGKYTINEPACGGGAMIIGAIKTMQSTGLNYQKHMEIVCQDLDWKGVYMCYVQLSLLGVSATVVQGDTLCNPYKKGVTPERNILRTPKKMGVII